MTIGVTKSGSKWQAQRSISRNNRHFGLFPTATEAGVAHDLGVLRSCWRDTKAAVNLGLNYTLGLDHPDVAAQLGEFATYARTRPVRNALMAKIDVSNRKVMGKRAAQDARAIMPPPPPPPHLEPRPTPSSKRARTSSTRLVDHVYEPARTKISLPRFSIDEINEIARISPLVTPRLPNNTHPLESLFGTSSTRLNLRIVSPYMMRVRAPQGTVDNRLLAHDPVICYCHDAVPALSPLHVSVKSLLSTKEVKFTSKAHVHLVIAASDRIVKANEEVARALLHSWRDLDLFARGLVPVQAQIVVRRGNESFMHRDKFTGAEAFVEGGWRCILDVNDRPMAFMHGPEVLAKLISPFIAMNGAAAGQYCSSLFHGKMDDGASVVVDVVPITRHNAARFQSYPLVRLARDLGLYTAPTPIPTPTPTPTPTYNLRRRDDHEH